MTQRAFSGRVNVDEREVERGLARLVLLVLEILRELIERQAVRRFRTGSLTDEQADRLGDTLVAMRDRMDELCELFGVGDEPKQAALAQLAVTHVGDHTTEDIPPRDWRKS